MRALLLALALVGCVDLPRSPAETAANAYDAARAACIAYRFTSARDQTPEADAACEAILGVCGRSDLLLAPPPAYGNKIVGL